MPKKTGSRKRTAGRAKTSKKKRTSNKNSFKAKALKQFPSTTRSTNLTYYETTSNGTQTVIPCPNLSLISLNPIPNTNTWDGRDGQSIYLKGFRIRCHFQNKLFRPCVVHQAICLPRDGQKVGQTEPFGNRFFKRLGIGTGGNRDDIDFNDPAMQGIHYATLPINTDTWNVIWHTRFKLGVTSTTAGYSSGELKNYRSLYRYIPINKVIRYRDNDSNLPEDEQMFWMFTWACPMDYENTQGQIEDALAFQKHVVMVYKRTGGA